MQRGKGLLGVRSTVSKFGFGETAKPSYSPLEFDEFIPWVCVQWCASTAVIVERKIQEPYVSVNIKTEKKASSKASRRASKPATAVTRQLSTADHAEAIKEVQSLGRFKSRLLQIQDKIVPITTYYDTKQHLVEIEIIGSVNEVSRKVIHAISLGVPFHPYLIRFTFRRSGLTDQLIYEINKLLPISNITEICFDDSYVRQGNYYILLEQPSLKYLSLNRCKINNEVCKRIFSMIDFKAPSANSLKILELGSNQITDIGAKFIASVLKTNRCLLHLNLSGNRITDKGFEPILNTLMEFQLSEEEKMAMRHRKLIFIENKIAVYERCLSELKQGKSDADESSTSASTSGKKMATAMRRLSRRKSKKQNLTALSVLDIAEFMTRGIVGDFNDPYGPSEVVTKNGHLYCKGNMVFCSINMAYNNLQFQSIHKLLEVLQYQQEMNNHGISTGLMRINLDGNFMPESCSELDEIDAYMKRVVLNNMPISRKTRTSSSIRRLIPEKPSIKKIY